MTRLSSPLYFFIWENGNEVKYYYYFWKQKMNMISMNVITETSHCSLRAGRCQNL